jgi:hypothetical protein
MSRRNLAAGGQNARQCSCSGSSYKRDAKRIESGQRKPGASKCSTETKHSDRSESPRLPFDWQLFPNGACGRDKGKSSHAPTIQQDSMPEQIQILKKSTRTDCIRIGLVVTIYDRLFYLAAVKGDSCLCMKRLGYPLIWHLQTLWRYRFRQTYFVWEIGYLRFALSATTTGLALKPSFTLCAYWRIAGLFKPGLAAAFT